MRSATYGVWINYGSTAIFQIVFASAFGGGQKAASYVLAFSLVLFIGSIFVSCTQTLVVPRLLASTGAVNCQAIRFVLVTTAIALAALTATLVAAPGISHLLAPRAGIGIGVFQPALRMACVFMIINVLASQVLYCLLVLGRRFGPAAAPTLPSLAGIAALLSFHSCSVVQLFAFMTLGSLAELLLLAYLWPRGARWSAVPLDGLTRLTVMTALQSSLLAALPFIDRFVASLHGADGVAQFNYALRGLALAQQLLVGGIVLTGLGHWSALAARHELQRVSAAVCRTVSGAFVLLTSAAATGVWLALPLVRLVYQRGAFTAADSTAVAHIVTLGALGFATEGIGLVVSQALVSLRCNAEVIAIGFGNAALRIPIAVLLGDLYGPGGVALAYSVASGASLAVQLFILSKRIDLRTGSFLSWRRVLVVSGLLISLVVGSEAGGSELLVSAFGGIIVFLIIATQMRVGMRAFKARP